jgi:hypothetical protein
MAGRRRAVVLGETRGRATVALLCRELDEAIRSLGLSYAALGRDVGLSGAQVGRIARGKSPDLSIAQASTLFAGVGHELSIRAYPTGRPLRDAPQLSLLARLRLMLHEALGWRTEVPVTNESDLRAWDAVIQGAGWRYGVEAETRLRDIQALQRRVALKLRDGDVDGVILVVWRTRTNLAILRSLGAELDTSFPVPGRLALERLGSGRDPSGSAIVVL